jgi:hypothetical protein
METNEPEYNVAIEFTTKSIYVPHYWDADLQRLSKGSGCKSKLEAIEALNQRARLFGDIPKGIMKFERIYVVSEDESPTAGWIYADA